MKLIVQLFFLSLLSFTTKAQVSYHILFEGEYPIDGDSIFYQNLDWYGYYQRDSLHDDDLIEKVQLKLAYLEDYGGVWWKSKPTIISTSSPRKSLFLLGVERGRPLDFKSEFRCGSTCKYSFQQTSLLPGRWVNWGTPTMSCSNLSIYALGGVRKSKNSYVLSDYKILMDRLTFMSEKPKTQEITDDIFGKTKSPLVLTPYGVPYIYATGDFDFDALTDFILWHEGTFYLYLTRYAQTKDIVKLVAKSKLKMMIDVGFADIQGMVR